MINRNFFFDRVRSHLFAGTLKQKQVQGLDFILDVWEASHAKKDDRWLAYALGTAYHETAFTMQPIHEIGGNAYFFKMYDPQSPDPKRRIVAKNLGNMKSGDGVLFHGRGYVQLTGRTNYQKMGAAFGVDLTSNQAAADRVLDAGLAAKIMFKGMEDGIFTGLGFPKFFSGPKEDWVNARKIINGLDRAQKIAVHSKEFYSAISYTA